MTKIYVIWLRITIIISTPEETLRIKFKKNNKNKIKKESGIRSTENQCSIELSSSNVL